MDSNPLRSRAVVLDGFGDASHLRVQEIDTPRPVQGDELLVRVHGTSVNPIEWKMRQGMGLPAWAWRRAIGSRMVLGLDFAGTVAAVGPNAGDFRVGDAVMGAMPLAGTYADYLLVRPNDKRVAIAKKPPNVSLEAAGVVPFAGLVAYAGLVTHGRIAQQASHARVLIIGASGGVGHLAVQMAKHGLAAGFVAGVSSSRNTGFVRTLGADHVVAYDQVPIETIPQRYLEWERSFDLIFDAVGMDTYYRSLALRLLKPTGRFVSAALPQTTPGQAGEDVGLLGGISLISRLALRKLRGRYSLITGLIGGLPSKDGFPHIVEWLAAGKINPHVSATFDLKDIADAHRASEAGRTVGKIAVRVGPQGVEEHRSLLADAA